MGPKVGLEWDLDWGLKCDFEYDLEWDLRMGSRAGIRPELDSCTCRTQGLQVQKSVVLQKVLRVPAGP